MDDGRHNGGEAASQQWEHTRWNFLWLVTESSAFQIGMAWVDPSAVLPLFMGHLTKSTVLLGLAVVLLRFGWVVPQLVIALIVGHRARRAPFLRWGVFFGRIPLTLFVLYLWIAGLANPGLVLVGLLVSYAFIALGNGVVAVPLQDITAKSIPPWLRGRFFGTIVLATAIATFGVGYLVRGLLGPSGPGFPRDYTILFTMMALFLGLSTLGCGMAREPLRPVLAKPETLGSLVSAALHLVRRVPGFLSLVAVSIVGVGLALSMPFYMVYATERLSVPPEMAGIYIWAGMLGAAGFSMLWGYLNDRRGPRSVLRGGSLAITFPPVLALVLPALAEVAHLESALPYLFALVFMTGGATRGAFRMGLSNYLFELASDEERPRYIAIMNTLAVPGTLVPLLVGWGLNSIPFQTVFTLLAAAGTVTLGITLSMPNRKS